MFSSAIVLPAFFGTVFTCNSSIVKSCQTLFPRTPLPRRLIQQNASCHRRVQRIDMLRHRDADPLVRRLRGFFREPPAFISYENRCRRCNPAYRKPSIRADKPHRCGSVFPEHVCRSPLRSPIKHRHPENGAHRRPHDLRIENIDAVLRKYYRVRPGCLGRSQDRSGISGILQMLRCDQKRCFFPEDLLHFPTGLFKERNHALRILRVGNAPEPAVGHDFKRPVFQKITVFSLKRLRDINRPNRPVGHFLENFQPFRGKNSFAVRASRLRRSSRTFFSCALPLPVIMRRFYRKPVLL